MTVEHDAPHGIPYVRAITALVALRVVLRDEDSERHDIERQLDAEYPGFGSTVFAVVDYAVRAEPRLRTAAAIAQIDQDITDLTRATHPGAPTQ